MMEKMTSDVMSEVNLIMGDIQIKGGMLQALNEQWVQQLIQTRSAKTQANIDSGQQKIVGANSLLQNSKSLNFDSDILQEEQSFRINQIRSERNALNVKRALKNLTTVGMSGKGNLLEATINAIKHRATIEECTAALELVDARFTQQPLLVHGAYNLELETNADWENSKLAVMKLSHLLKRKPRVLISKIGQDGHDRGANVITAILADAGFEVKQVPLFNDLQKIASYAESFGADLIAISSLANAHNELMPPLIDILHSRNIDAPVALGGIVPLEHHENLISRGVAYVMQPGVSITKAIPTLLSLIQAD